MYANENISEEEEEEEDAQLMSAEPADNSKDTAKVHRFDRRLPVTHSYLGDVNQGELSAEALFEEPGEQIKVPGRQINEWVFYKKKNHKMLNHQEFPFLRLRSS